jgi:predicted enzyme related to lactoylglutathione lyase
VHLDFIVPEINAAVQRATAAGAHLEGEVRTAKWGRIAVFADPFGRGYDEDRGSSLNQDGRNSKTD